MKLKARHIIILIIAFLAIVYFFIPSITDSIGNRGNEKTNIHLNYVGSDNGRYATSKAVLLDDGSIIIASSLLNRKHTISLMKLDPVMKLVWEKKLSDNSYSFIKNLFQHKSITKVADIEITKDICYIFVIEENADKYSPSIISTDMNGKLLGYKKVPYSISSITAPMGTIMGENAYFSWFNGIDKMIMLDKISLETAKIAEKKFIYIIQDSLKYTYMTSEPVNKVVLMTTYDPYKGSSLLSYDEKVGLLRILNDTNRYQTLQLVDYFDSNLYVVATKDSSLVLGLVHPDKEPDKVISFNLETSDFTPKAFLCKEGTYFIGLDERKPQAHSGMDVVIKKYDSTNKLTGEYLISGKYTDTLNQLLQCKDGSLLAIGNSDRHKLGFGARVWVSKFKL